MAAFLRVYINEGEAPEALVGHRIVYLSRSGPKWTHIADPFSGRTAKIATEKWKPIERASQPAVVRKRFVRATLALLKRPKWRKYPNGARRLERRTLPKTTRRLFAAMIEECHR